MDGWCNALLIKEVLACYKAQRQGQTLTLQPPRPYRDYILWLQQQDQQAAQAYWQKTLAGFAAPTPLGIDRLRLTSAPSEHCDQWLTLSQNLTADLNACAQRHHLTLNTLIQGAWALVLSRYSDTGDVVFGATVSGRPPTLPGADSIVGLFINTVPVRVSLPPEMPLLPWLQQIQADQRDRETYSFSRLTDIQSWSQVPHGTPLFESLLVFENYPVSLNAALTDDSSGLTIREGKGFEQTNYPLALVVIPGETLALRMNYDQSRIPTAAIHRLLNHLETLLQGMIADPDQPLATLLLLTPAEQQQFQTWNHTQQPIPERCVHELIADQAKATPDATAVVFEDTTLSYRKLDYRSKQLANYLVQQGVQPGDRVAVCLERSAELVITLLAILKTGATYVPLDPTYPAERLRFILEDAQVSLLITANSSTVGSAPMVDRLTADSMVGSAHLPIEAITNNTLPILDLAREADAIAHLPTHLPTHSPTHPPTYPPTHPPSSLAYLIYTSGSTGTPKGVAIRHASLTNLLSAMAQAPGMTARDTLLAVTTPAFDIAALELFLPLTVGGTLVIASQDTVRDPHKLAAQLEQHDITLMQATPATWRLLLESGWAGKANLKLLCGGEALDVSLAQKLLECGQELWNLYGPTETTIWSAALQIESSMLQDGIVPIGKPIANTQFYVLDSQQNPVPVGVPGELHIGGIGLSSGYWNREGLTAEWFVANPPLKKAEGRRQKAEIEDPFILHPSSFCLYKTGDRVRLREDGTLEYLGRLDYQIKLRGFRIELGEIEAVLTQHPQISQAVVTLHKESEESQLVAYVVSNCELKTQNLKLKTYLSQHLLPYMLPSQFVVLDALPLTPNGKVDRKALPKPESTETAQTSITPLTLTEELLANIWSAVLTQDSIGRDENFFELGGTLPAGDSGGGPGAAGVWGRVAGAIVLRAPHSGSTCDRN